MYCTIEKVMVCGRHSVARFGSKVWDFDHLFLRTWLVLRQRQRGY